MLSVIICTYNRDRYIYNVLESLAKNDYPKDDYEIVVVDNNCTDNTAGEINRFSRDWPDVRLKCCRETRQGLSYARNRGISEAEGDILVYVDDDAFVNPGYIGNYASLFARRADIYAAGGPIIPHYEGGGEPDWMTYHLKRLLTGYLDCGVREKPFPRGNYPGGGNAAYRRQVFDSVGLYNPELGRKGSGLGGGEEKDIFDRMRMFGMKFVYTPGSILYHSIPQYKLEQDYFDRLTCGIGASERTRTLGISKAKYAERLASELVKWGGTLVIGFYYAFRFRLQCARKLLRFRWNVSRKLLGGEIV